MIRLLNSMKYAFIKTLSFSPRSHTHINNLHFAAFRRTCMHTEINFMPLHSAALACTQKQTSCHRFRCTHIHTKRKFISSYSHISHRFHLLLFFIFYTFVSFASSRDLTIHNFPHSSFLSHLPYHDQRSASSPSFTPSFTAVSVQRIGILCFGSEDFFNNRRGLKKKGPSCGLSNTR